jgi:hypothetical protein
VGGLTPAELAAIRGRLEAFADEVFASLPRADQHARGKCYLRGMMLDDTGFPKDGTHSVGCSASTPARLGWTTSRVAAGRADTIT